MRVGSELADRLRKALLWYQQRTSPWQRYTAVSIWAALIWILSARPPGGGASGPFFEHLWNSAHVVVFGVLCGLIILSTRRCTGRGRALAVAVSLAYGVLDEVHQDLTGRVFDVWDVCSDGLGACMAACGLTWLFEGGRARALWLLGLTAAAAASVHMAAS
jgi:VanZ family protein